MKTVCFLLCALFLLTFSAMPASGHFDSPGQPGLAVRVRVEAVNLTADLDDGIDGNAEIDMTYNLQYFNSHIGRTDHDHLLNTKVELTDDYNWDTYAGGFQTVDVNLLGATPHAECSGQGEVSISFFAEEDSGTFLGFGVLRFTPNHDIGTYTQTVPAMSAGVVGAYIRFALQVDANPVGAAECGGCLGQEASAAASDCGLVGGLVVADLASRNALVPLGLLTAVALVTMGLRFRGR